MTIRIGTAPDAWGVWFPDDPHQTPYARFLDEVVAARYGWIELGPYGYLPTDAARLRDELVSRGLRLSAGTVFENLHQDGSWPEVWSEVDAVAKLTSAVGGTHLVVIPALWRHPQTGAVLEPPELSEDQWRRKTEGMNRLGREIYEKYGLRTQYHPHADSHVGTEEQVFRFLDGTNSEIVSLCLDTGHVTYCHGDSLNILNKYPDRIGYLHLKQVDPSVLARVVSEDLSFGEAVRLRVMTEPPRGVPDLSALLRAVERLGTDVFAIVEQDMYPCPPDAPLPIARRTRRYLSACGATSVRFSSQDR